MGRQGTELIVVDTSAVVAVVFAETERELFIRLIHEADPALIARPHRFCLGATSDKPRPER